MRFRATVALTVTILLGLAATAGGATLHLGDRGLRPGTRGHDVRVLQDLLTRAGFVATIDGRFGSSTGAAVRRFQRSAGLGASGIVGPATVRALRTAAIAGAAGGTSGSASPLQAPSLASGVTATVGADGLAQAPVGAPPAVVAAIAAGNSIAKLPYRWGGGHRDFTDTGYDCSGSVSYVLHGAALLASPLISGELARWGKPGAGTWITVYANEGHTFAVIAGLRFDTSGQSRAGTRWQSATRSTDGLTARHPGGL